MQPTRLFDAIAYQLKNFPKKDMLVAKQNGEWTKLSTHQIQQDVNNLSAGLLQLGVSAGDFSAEGADKIAIIANSCPEWLIADMAVQQLGAILIPIYPTTNENELAFILKEAEVRYIFIGNQLLLNKYQSTIQNIPSIQNTFSFDKTTADNWKEIIASATETSLQKVEEIKAYISNEHIATIIYTSGTTGIPKGVMLSHKNILSCVMLSKESFPLPDNPHMRALSFLPLNHIFEKCLSYVYLLSGISIYFAEGLEKIGDNIREVKPHIFTAVPRLLEKVFEKIMNAGYQLQGVRKNIFFWSVRLAKKYDNRKKHHPLYLSKLKIADRLVFSKWRKALGGHLNYIIIGGAACPESLLRIFNAAAIPVYEGYGPTENSPVISVNRSMNNQSLYGTVGPVIDGLQMKLESDGEICVKGPTVMAGYYKNEQLTKETIIDGWLHTGDIGALVEGKYLKITDRKKELFKTSNGKYIAPQPLENKLKESYLIEQAMVMGADEKYVGALIVPSFSALKNWMERHHLIFENNEQAIQHVEVRKRYSAIIKEANGYFNAHEQIKKHMILSKEWTVDTGELTPKLSLRRKVVAEKYKAKINKLFS
ncbi:AMP-dependent synthetase/ligase [Arachidicoccus sp.]|jgi:long-chain acyl-CoA synthetase|uniref:AMP-dependent synthetase/ligase n=1 Tax=Arachidicoccus sp. TaxID=1872624 RepID=UPI003D19B8C4